jgi:hypothetical protein
LIAVSMTVEPTSPSTVRAVPAVSMKVILTMAECRTEGGKQNLATAQIKSGRRAAPMYGFAPTGASAGNEWRETSPKSSLG